MYSARLEISSCSFRSAGIRSPSRVVMISRTITATSPCSIVAAPMLTSDRGAEHRGQLGPQRVGVEGFDDVVVDARLLRLDHVLGLALGRDHEERQGLRSEEPTSELQSLMRNSY